MRHALIRLWKMVGVDVKWFVPEGHPTVFDITKRKIHNVLQGVAPEGMEMNDEDKKWFELWTEQNCASSAPHNLGLISCADVMFFLARQVVLVEWSDRR